jgi:hypothetical protein
MWLSSSVTKDSVRQGASVRGGRLRCAARLPGHRCGSGVSGVSESCSSVAAERTSPPGRGGTPRGGALIARCTWSRGAFRLLGIVGASQGPARQCRRATGRRPRNPHPSPSFGPVGWPEGETPPAPRHANQPVRYAP